MVMHMRFKSPIPFPVGSFLGMDLKLGVSIISLFAVLNKVAGAYGMMAVLTGGTLAQPLSQLTMYLYSIATLVGVLWGLKKIAEENGPKVLLYAHLFALDHVVGTIFTSLFAVVWYIYVPHDGRRVANSDAQKEMMSEGSASSGTFLDEAARTTAAQAVWKEERGFSAAVLLLGWFIKIYFILCVYSYALHLRRNTYATLPKTRPRGISLTFGQNPVNGGRIRGGPLGARPVLATRRSSSGGARYMHVRGNSVATDSGTDTTMAETLWEDEGSDHTSTPTLPKSNSLSSAAGLARKLSAIATTQLDHVEAQPLSGADVDRFEPIVAKGTGMSRTMSGGILQRTDSGGAMGASGLGKADDDFVTTTTTSNGNGPVAAFR